MTEPPALPALPDDCWPIDPGCLDAAFADLTDDVAARSVALATSTLRRLTAYRVGGCPVTVRPCSQGWQGDALRGYQWASRGEPWYPALYSGVWINCGCEQPCRCSTGCEVKLPGVVGTVDEVRVGATPLDLAKITVVDGSTIRWQGGGDCPFPKCQDMSLPMGEPGTFSITYTPGYPVDGLGAWVAGVLAVEFAKACTDGKNCRLPKNVTAVVRQGVSLTLVPGSFPNGVTGIREVDAWIELWNPNRLKRRPSVWSPDLDDFVVERPALAPEPGP